MREKKNLRHHEIFSLLSGCYFLYLISIRFDDLSPFTSSHQHSQASDSLSPDPRSKVLGPKLIGSRGRPTGLPHRKACHPVAYDEGRLLSTHYNGGRSRSPNAESFIQLLGRLLARRKGRLVR